MALFPSLLMFVSRTQIIPRICSSVVSLITYVLGHLCPMMSPRQAADHSDLLCQSFFLDKTWRIPNAVSKRSRKMFVFFSFQISSIPQPPLQTQSLWTSCSHARTHAATYLFVLHAAAGQTCAGISSGVGVPPVVRIYTVLHIVSIVCHLPAVVISRPHPLPSVNEKAITMGGFFSLISSGLEAFSEICLLTCFHSCVCLSLRFPSLVPLLPFTVAADSLSFSILSAASLFRSSHLWARGCSGF